MIFLKLQELLLKHQSETLPSYLFISVSILSQRYLQFNECLSTGVLTYRVKAADKENKPCIKILAYLLDNF